MEQRFLPGTDLAVSRLCLGTMTFGSQVDELAAASIVDAGLERGINFIDTANVYNAGRSESILGRILGGRRDKVVLATKVGIKAGDGPLGAGLSQAAIMHQLEVSLRRLGTDYVDLYYLHVPDRSTPLEETLATVDELIRQGKVRHLGASNYAAWQVCRMRWLADRNGWQPIGVTQPIYNLLARGIEQEFLPMCQALGVASVVYNPLAGGLLTGKHMPGTSPLAGTRFDRMPVYQDRYWHKENFEAVERLAAAARESGRSLISLSLGWLLHHAAIDSVILGASSLDQLLENIRASDDGPCSDAALASCDAAWSLARGVSPAYSR